MSMDRGADEGRARGNSEREQDAREPRIDGADFLGDDLEVDIAYA